MNRLNSGIRQLISSAPSALVRGTGLRRGRYCYRNGWSRGKATAALPQPWFPIPTGASSINPLKEGSKAQDEGRWGALWHANAVPFCFVTRRQKFREKRFNKAFY
jgi:hypothetical protein